MGVQNFQLETEFTQQLKTQLAQHFSGQNTEDPAYIAEYLLVMISNNRSATEIVEEFTGLFGSIIDEKFVQDVINTILSHQNGEQQIQPQAQSQSQPQTQTQIQTQPQVPAQMEQIQNQSQFQQNQAPTQTDDDMAVDGTQNTNTADKEVRFDVQQPAQSAFNIPTGPTSAFGGEVITNKFSFTNSNNKRGGFKNQRGMNQRGGLNQRSNPKFNNKRQQNLGKMIEMSLDNNNEMTTNFVNGDRPSVRCKDFPHCPNKICSNVHPTKFCRSFPNCPNKNQTCTYLHPGEDDELFKEYERVREAKFSQKQAPINSGISLCKFGAICSKELCPFGHPTPANRDAKVTILQWCVDNKECKNTSCSRAHSSPNYQSQNSFNGANSSNNGMSASSHSNGAPVEKSLEQCKFGTHCKNYKCPKRHATSSVICRDGANCTRIDCTFLHPFNEVCKFGVNCTNVKCAYQHPEGRQVQSYGTPTGNKVWYNGQSQNTGTTSQRQFAVAEDQVLEQAPPQEMA